MTQETEFISKQRLIKAIEDSMVTIKVKTGSMVWSEFFNQRVEEIIKFKTIDAEKFLKVLD